jgi:hypothetical protein
LKRDLLSQILLTTKSILRRISWDKILIAGQWLKAEFVTFSSHIMTSQSLFSKKLSLSCQEIKILFKHCEDSYLFLWKNSFSLENLHLWEEGGHSATPITHSDWLIQKQISTVMTHWIGSISLPSYVDNWCNPLAYLPNNIPLRCDDERVNTPILSYSSLRTNQQLVADWIGVLCTFYWSNTNEISISSKKDRSLRVNVAYQPLIERLLSSQKTNIEHIISLMGTNFEQELSTESGSMEVVTSESETNELLIQVSQCSRRIDFELLQNGSLLGFALTEQDIIRSFFKISNLVGEINFYLLTCCSYDVLKEKKAVTLVSTLLLELLAQSKIVLSHGLNHSIFNPIIFRELQTLLWFLESLLSSPSKNILFINSDNFEVLKQLSIRFSVMFDLRLYALVTRNLSNSYKSLSFNWDSTTLMRFAKDPYFAEDELMTENLNSPRNDIDISELRMNGPIRLIQSSMIELILRLLNLNSMKLPLSSSKALHQLARYNDSRLTVSTCQEVRTKLSQMFQQIAHNSCEFKMTSPLETISRLDLMAYYTLSLIHSIRDHLDQDVYHQYLQLMSLVNPQNVCTTRLFDDILRLDLPAHISNNYLLMLVNQCLLPVLNILSSEVIRLNVSDNFLNIQHAWVCLGILRYKLSLPASPVDPALRAAHESSLHSLGSAQIKNQMVVEKLDSSIRGDGLTLPSQSGLEERFVELELKIAALHEQAIQRPEDSPLFHELFQDVHDLSDNILNSDRILAMLSDCLHRYSEIKNGWPVTVNTQFVSTLESHLSQLTDYSHNELIWQSTLDNFIIRLQTIFSNFEDITSPIVSALQNISFGVRQIVSFVFTFMEESVHMKTPNSLQVLEKSVESLFSIPCTVRLSLLSNTDSALTNLLINTLEDIPHSIQLFSDRTARKLGSSTQTNLSTIFSNCLVLSKMDYFLGSDLAQPSLFYGTFSECMNYFIASYRGIIEEKARLEFKKSSLYQYREQKEETEPLPKSTTHIFESNDEKEELEAIRANFPDHLGEFQDIINPTSMGSDEVMATDSSDKQLAGDDVMTEEMIGTLLNIYSRMLLLYLPQELRNQRTVWNQLTIGSTVIPSVSKKPSKRRKVTPLSESFITKNLSTVRPEITDLSTCGRESVLQYSIVVSKAFESGLSYIPSSKVDSIMKGFGLSILGSITKECRVQETNSNVSWLTSLLHHHESHGSTIDRDLLYLLDSTVGTTWNPYNIHLHSDCSEILLTGPPLRKMLQHAVDLLVRFPGNDFLLAICKITSRIAQFSIHEPIGKMLQSLQLLLKSTQEWEQYAAKHVSLIESIQSITALISRWRTLELKSWTSLLRSREIVYVQRARKYWFTLHSLLNSFPEMAMNVVVDGKDMQWISLFTTDQQKSCSTNGLVTWLFTGAEGNLTAHDPKASINQHYNKLTDSVHHLKGKHKKKKKNKHLEEDEPLPFDEEKYLVDIFESLDGFLRACVVGEFPVRLHLLRLFCLEKFEVHLIQMPRKMKYQSILQMKIASICYGVWCYYSQFLPVVRKFQEVLKTPLQTRLNDEIKISKWDELNVYAVMEHSERVHRKLTKIIREYECDVLDYPVTAVLQREIMSSLISEQGELKASTEIPPMESMFPYTDQPKFQTERIKLEEPIELAEENNSEDVTEAKPVPVEVVEILPLDYIEPEDNSLMIIGKYSRSKDDTIDTGDIATVLSNLITTIPTQRLMQLPKLSSKMNQYLSAILELPPSADTPVNGMPRYDRKVRYGLMVAEISENLCSDIFYRIETLRAQPTEKSNRSVKHRAFADLLHRLKEEGISHLRSLSPNQSKTSVDLFSLPSVTPIEYASNLSHSMFGERLSVLDKGENYFYRNICEINQLRAQALSPYSADVTAREVQVMLGQTEFLFFHLLKSRAFLSEGLKSVAELLSVTDTLKSLKTTAFTSSSPGVPTQQVMRDVWRYINQAGKVLKCSILEVKDLLVTAVACDREHPSDIWTTNPTHTAQLPKWKVDLLFAALDGVILSLEKVLSFNSQHNELLHDPITPCLLMNIQSNEMLLFPPNFVDTFTQFFEQLKVSTAELATSTPYLTEALSADVITPLNSQLSEFLSTLTVHQISFNTSNAQQGSVVVDDCAQFLKPLTGVVDDCLITVQNLRSFSNDTNLFNHKKGFFNEDISLPFTVENMAQSSSVVPLCSCLSLALKAFSSMKIPAITSRLTEILQGLQCTNNENLLIPTVFPLVDNVISSCLIFVDDLLAAYKSIGKLLYICLRTFRVLLAKGFCSDQTKDGGEGDGESNDISKMVFEDDVEGTGMGEGEGKKDVSDQIENEEQLLGTKNENEQKEQEKANKQLNEEEKETGVEMMQDFEGDMCDLPDDQKKEDDSDNQEEEEEQDLEREMGGELDYENIVDEKQWDNESEDEDQTNPEEEKFENESKAKGETLEGEMNTNDQKNEEDSSPEEKDAKEGEKGESKGKDESDDEGEGQNDESKVRDEDEMEKPLGVDVKQDEESKQDEKGAEEENNPDGDNEEDGLGGEPKEGEEKDEMDEEQEFPENMELEGGGGSGEDESLGEDPPDDLDDEELPKQQDEEDDSASNQDQDNEEKEDNSTSLGGNNNSEGPEQEPDITPEEEMEPQQLELNAAEEKKKNNAANIGLKSQQGTDSVVESGEIIEEEKDPNQSDDINDQNSKDNKKNSAGSSVSEGVKSQKNNDQPEENEDNSKGGAQSGNESKQGEHAEGESQQPENKSDRRKMEPPNPFRKLGDINKRWEKRLNMDTSPDEDQQPEQSAQEEEEQKSAAYEFELENDKEEKEVGAQVLAEASEKDAVHLNEKTEEQGQEDEAKQGPPPESESANQIMSEQSKREKKRDRSEAPEEEESDSGSDDQQISKKSKHLEGPCDTNDEDDTTSDFEMPEVGEDQPKGEAKEEEKTGPNGGLLVNNLESWTTKEENSSSTVDPNPLRPEDTQDDLETLEIEEAMKEMSTLDEHRLRKGHEQWAQLTAQYQSPCIRLTEQLRLVLEPTLASRLQGDYRTGKRISMRRVIGYVASGFRKDKIWLRRTKPYKREYQVMVMIDDSRSMGDAGPIALAALNVLSGALTRLEVGHIGVCSFAEHVSCLHTFDQPFNETSGSRVLSQFNFSASQTRLASALHAVLPLFEESKSLSSSSSSISVQICFIISDARIDSENREKLTAIVRELAEKHILAVLIIIDKNENQKDSIFATKSVEFTPTGLVTKSYLDDFPFPYYVAIQQIDALPEVLAGALKQWFELVRSELDGAH